LDLAELAAIVFAIMTLGVVGFQLALALGAPWGAYAMGGAFPGRYPVRMRVAAVVQAVVLAIIALAVLSAAGVVATPWGATPTWVTWGVAALLGVGLVLNLITPSAGERRIWAPVVAVMFACCIVVAVSS
jgi:hypothetical protein